MSKLYVKDLATGGFTRLYDALDQDLQETWAVNGLYPNMDWTPDSKSIVFWAGGKIRRVDLSGHLAGDPVPRQRYARGDRSAAAEDRGGAGHVPHEDAALSYPYRPMASALCSKAWASSTRSSCQMARLRA